MGGIIKTHADVVLFGNQYPEAKIVYVWRDPRDVLVSFFHYLNSDELYASNPDLQDQRCSDFSAFLRRPLSNYLLNGFADEPTFVNVIGRWASHVAGWLARPGVCAVTYEHLRRRRRSTLMRVCFSLGIFPRFFQADVGLHDAPSVLPRRGRSGEWERWFTKKDEDFLKSEIANYGLHPPHFAL